MVSFKTGTFLRSGTSQSITGVGFQPKAVILIATSATVNAFEADYKFVIGFASSTTAARQRSYSAMGWDAKGPADVDSGYDSTSVYNMQTGGADFDETGQITALGADGFTVAWTGTAFGFTITYICIGGTDVTNTFASALTAPSSTGNQAITGVGFQPDCVIMVGTNVVADSNVDPDIGAFCVGFANKDLEQGVCACAGVEDVATMDNARYQRTDKCLAMFNDANMSALTHEASLTAVGVDGFTLNYTTANVASKRVMYLALKGGRYKIGSLVSPIVGTPPVVQSITTVGFQPRGLMLMSIGNVASTSIQTHSRISFGAANSATSRFCNWTANQDAGSEGVSASRIDNNQVIRVSDEAATHTSTTTQALADMTGFVTGGYNLSWSVRDTVNAFQVIYLAFGDVSTLYARPVTATVQLTANVARKKKVARPTPATVVISASAARIYKTRKTAAASLTIIESVLARRRIPRALSESFSVTANITRFVRAIEVCAASLTISATTVRIFKIGRSAAEVFSINTAVLTGERYPKFVTEALTITGNVARFYRSNKTVSAALTIVDSSLRRIVQHRFAVESPVIAATGNRLAKIRRSMAESLVIATAAVGHRLVFHNRSVTESLAVFEDGIVEICTATGQIPILIKHKLGRYFSILPQRNIRAYVFDSVFFKRKERET